MKYCYKIAPLLASSFILSAAYAAPLGHITLVNPELGLRTITYEQINGYAVVEGDILIDTLEHMKHQGAVIRTKIGGSRWPKGIIPFELSEDLPFKNKLAVYEAIDHWQTHSNLEFVELTAKNHHKYRDYISFIPAQGTTCSSYVGRKNTNRKLILRQDAPK